MSMLPPLLDRKRGRGLAAVAALTVVQGAAAGAAAFATRSLFEAMHGGASLPVTELAVLVGAGAMIAVTRVVSRQLGERIGQAYARQIRTALFDHAARMPAHVVASRRAGYMSLRFVGDMTAFRNWLGLGLPRLIAAVVLIPAMLLVLWVLDPVFALVVTPIFALCLVLIAWGGLRLVPLQRRLRARRARIAAEMAERMPMAPHLDRLGRRGKELGLLDKRTDAMVSAALAHRFGVESLKALPDIAAGIAAALVIFAGYQVGLGTGSIAAALAVLGLLLSPLRDLGGVWNHQAAYRAAAIKAQAALSRAQRDVYRGGKSLPKGAVEVLFDDVALPSGMHFSFRAEGGEATELVLGELDAEAVIDTLLGLDGPQAGAILLSGIDLRDLSRGTLRRDVQRIGTMPDILQGSLRRALVMGCDVRPDDDVLTQMARDAGLSALLDRVGGLDGSVLEGGKNLAQAERLAISLVRIRLSRPRLVLLGPDVNDETAKRLFANLSVKERTLIRLHTHALDALATV
ncbi:MAG: ABC transporter transmembrane domain-containing protein [Paracoccaceae bacterium]